MQRLNLTIDELKLLRNVLRNSRRREPAKAPTFDLLKLKIANAILDGEDREDNVAHSNINKT